MIEDLLDSEEPRVVLMLLLLLVFSLSSLFKPLSEVLLALLAAFFCE